MVIVKLTQVQLKTQDLSCAGSNTHNNGNPAGDGQAGDAGEGTAGVWCINPITKKKKVMLTLRDKEEGAGISWKLMSVHK